LIKRFRLILMMIHAKNIDYKVTFPACFFMHGSAQAGCSRVLARPAACLAAPAALAVSDVLPPRRAPLPVTPLLAIAHDQCSAYCPFE